MTIGTRPLKPLELERLRRAFDRWDKPLSPPRAVPKAAPKKKGRPIKEDKI